VENLVKFVKANFLAGRTFYDDADLAEQCREWLRQVNTERPSDATGEAPAVLLAQEQPQFGPLPAVASDYGFLIVWWSAEKGWSPLKPTAIRCPLT
jgi:hypothetical protein